MAQKLRIRLKAYDHKVLDQAASRIVDTAARTGTRVAGPVPLPTSIAKYTVIRSPFIDKDSREQFEMRTHKRLIDILEPSNKTVDALMRLNLPDGTEMVMPGDNTEMKVELIQPIAMEEGLRFAIREGGRTVGAGRVTKIVK